MRIKLFYICVVWLVSSMSCIAKNEVKVHLTVNPEKKSFTCKYQIKLQPKAKRSHFVFTLNKAFHVEGVRSKGQSKYEVRPFFDLFQKDTLKRIEVAFANNSKSTREVTISYSGNVPERFFTDNVLEFSAHTNWLPNIPGKEYELVSYELEVSVEDGYQVISTSHPVGQKPGTYTFRGSAPNIEITAIAATEFEELSTGSEGHTVSVYKAGRRMNAADTTLLRHTREAIAYFNQTIGKEHPIATFTVLLPGTNRDAFGLLDNAVNITYADFNTNNVEDRLILAHEISHKWWAYGRWNDYNNWLNEAFATYASLLYLRAIGDTATYEEEIAKRQASSKNSPALVGFDVSKHDYKTDRKSVV